MTGAAPDPTSILAFRNGSIGNTLVAVPALRALKRRWPGVPLSVVVDPVGGELLAHCPWIDRLIVYDKRGRDRGAAGWCRLVGRLRATRPSHALLFKRFFRNGLLARLSGAGERLGFSTGGRAPFLNRTIPYEEGVPVVDLNLRLAALAGASTGDRAPEFWLSEADEREAARFLGALPEFVAAHYGGLSTPPDFLPPRRFAELLSAIVPAELPLLLLGSPGREAAWAETIRAGLGSRPIRIAHGLPLRVTAALLARARLLVGFNSGPAHLAAAVGTPALVLFRPGPGAAREIAKWLPARPEARPLVPPADEAGWPAFLETAASRAREMAR